MPILTGDIKLVASQVMDDVPEGGGAPTATVITDGTSNAIFPDISELDRAGGRVNLRKLHVSVQTNDTAIYMGSNMIVSEPPSDPNVSVTLFTTSNTFDRRDAAKSRIESYLNQGPEWPGYLFENHIAGQRSVQIFQRPETDPPTVGRTLVLIANEGLSNEIKQYVRVTRTEAVVRLFYDEASGKDYEGKVVTAEISDALRTDFPGTPAKRTFTRNAGAVHLRDTLVADAGTYAGVVPLMSPVNLGDVTALVKSVYTQLVPSAQTEIPLVDLKPNGELAIYSAAGTPFSLSTSIAFDSTNAIAVGQSVLPGSLTITAGSVQIKDSAGVLVVGTQQIGTVDYCQGILSITDTSASYAGLKAVVYTPAAAPLRALNTASWAVTAEARSSTYVTIIDPPPAPGTTSISYMAQGRWYSLRDLGNGQLKSLNGSYGTGTLNYTTGSLVVTLAALPDVGSQVLATYGLASTEKNHSGLPIKVQTTMQLAHGAVAPSTVTITWTVNSVAKTASDNGLGSINGDATGTVDYISGIVVLKPNLLPSGGAQFSVVYSWGDPLVENFVAPERGPGGALTLALSHPNVMPRTVRVEWNTVYNLNDITTAAATNTRFIGFTVQNRDPIVTVLDNGAGSFSTRPECAAVIDYAAGSLSFKPETTIAMPTPRWKKVSLGTRVLGIAIYEDWKNIFEGYDYQTIGATFPGDLTAYVKVTYRTTAAGSTSTEQFNFNPTVDLTAGFRDPIVPGSVNVTLGAKRYIDRQGSLVSAINYSTGAATNSGSVNYSSGLATFTVLNEGVSNAGVIDGLTTVQGPMPVMSVQFRTSAAPLRPSSFIVQFVLADDLAQTVVTLSANAQGVIEDADVQGKIDYQSGVVTLRFGRYMTAAGNESAYWYDAALIQNGQIFVSKAVLADSIRYAAVAYSYLPLDAALLGLDPVRLPQDGRVPIFRTGGFAVVGNTQKITATVSNAQTINCARVRLSRVRVLGFNAVVINTGYSADLEAGTVTFTDVGGYSQPVTIEHRIEDMVQVSDVQINGQLGFTRQVTHDYPVQGSFISSALISADLKARVSYLFDQSTWNGTTWVDAVSGTTATGTYNDVIAPVVVANKGAVSERWALLFTNTTTFNIIGEHVGVIGTGSINTDTSPLNPATGVPYFTIPALGWGIGWAAGNVLRLNTVGAMFPVWVVRTVQQGPNSGTEHSFTLLSRGDVDRT